MTLITRFTRLFSADVHAVLDQIEEPAVLLRHAVREMEEELATMRARRHTRRSELERLQGEIRSAERRRDALDEELDLCFDCNEEQLARALVKRKLETERGITLIVAQHDTLARSLEDMDACITQSEQDLADTRQQILLADTPVGVAGRAPATVAADEIEVAFLREKRRRAAR